MDNTIEPTEPVNTTTVVTTTTTTPVVPNSKFKLSTFISQFFQDETKMSSATRLVFIVWGLGVFGVWAAMSIMTRQLQPIPQTVVEITLITMAGKVSGAWVENATSK